MNLVPNMSMEPYMDAQATYSQPLSMDMLDDLSWPCQFMSPDLSPQYVAMPSYPISPMSPASMTMVNHEQRMTIQRQRQCPPLSPRTSVSSNHTGRSPTSPRQGFATVVQQQHQPKQDRERRKAQNRASQRAYRERKEIQLRDLAASLKETEAAMAEAKQENRVLEARLEKMRTDLAKLKKENAALKGMDDVNEEVSLQEVRMQQKQEKGTMKIESVPTPPHTDEEYDGASRSNTASVIGTPKDVEFAMDGFNWDDGLLPSKEMPTEGPDLGDVEIFW